MGKSTYDSICEALMKTPEAQKYKETISQILGSGFTHSYSYVEKSGTSEMMCRVTLTSKYEPTLKPHIWDESWRNTTSGADKAIYVYISIENMIDSNVLDYIFRSNWGVPKRPGGKKYKVPTYGLKADECLKKWKDHFKKVVPASIEMDQHTVGYAEGKKIQEFLDSQVCREAKAEARTRAMIDTVKKAILKYKDITEEIIKTACDEACCELVTED